MYAYSNKAILFEECPVQFPMCLSNINIYFLLIRSGGGYSGGGYSLFPLSWPSTRKCQALTLRKEIV